MAVCTLGRSSPQTLTYTFKDAASNFRKMPYIYTQLMGKKKRRKTEKLPKTEEELSIKSSNDIVRLQDRVGTPQTSISIAKAIRRQVHHVLQGNVTSKHFARMNQYRMAKFTGNTHDYAPAHLPSTFVTPLTKLQHESQLPTTMEQIRHDFPYLLSYTVEWLSAASPAPSYTDKKVELLFNVNDLNLDSKQMRKIMAILGSKYNVKTGVVRLVGDVFDDLNQNAAYLGDITQRLMRAVRY